MTPLKSICVYCGSAFGANPKHRAMAQRFGELLGRNGIDLVYGGGRVGLMGVIADAALKNGSKVIGVIPEHLQSKEVGHHGISELRVVPNMHERKELMFQLSDAFVILPGGFGTLDETFEMITWRQLRLHDKPIVLLDIDGYWAPSRSAQSSISSNRASPGPRRWRCTRSSATWRRSFPASGAPRRRPCLMTLSACSASAFELPAGACTGRA